MLSPKLIYIGLSAYDPIHNGRSPGFRFRTNQKIAGKGGRIGPNPRSLTSTSSQAFSLVASIPFHHDFFKTAPPISFASMLYFRWSRTFWLLVFSAALAVYYLSSRSPSRDVGYHD